jgi:hypothetical protein
MIIAGTRRGEMDMSLRIRFKKAIARYLAQLEAANKKAFGNGTPDCCKMNSQNNRLTK